MERTLTPRIRRVCAGLLALGLALTGITLTSTAAQAATVSTSYVSDVDGVTTSDVDAIEIDSSTNSLSVSWYVCNGVFTTASAMNVSNDVNVILGDNCVWSAARFIMNTGSLTFWSGVNNTGRMNVSGTGGNPALLVPSTASLTIKGGSITASSSQIAAAIGGNLDNANGPITIQWRANVKATGGAPASIYGAGAGIGGGGSSTTTSVGGAGILINTTGLVQATGGAASGTFTAGANIGGGGTNGGTAGLSSIATVNADFSPSIGSGTVQMRAVDQSLVTAALVPNVAHGSNVTYVATPANGWQVSSVQNAGGDVTPVGNNVYRFEPTAFVTTTNIFFIFVAMPTVLTLSASPVSPQTYPGNVTLSATFTDGGTPIANMPVVFGAGSSTEPPVLTNSAGVATFTFESPPAGTYTWTATSAGGGGHAAATATPITGYVVLGLQPNFAITAPSSADTVYGHAPLSLATSGQLSSGAVVWSVPAGNGVATIDPATGELTILAAGTVTVTANAPADATHAAATATRTITIAPRAVTVTADTQSVQFGDSIQLTWTPTPALVGSDTLSGSLKLAGPVLNGDVEIVEDAPFENSNYAVTFVPGTLTVTPNDAQQAAMDAIDLMPLPITTLDQADSVALATLAFDALTADELDALPASWAFRLLQAQAQAAVVNHADSVNGVAASGDALPWQVRLVVTPEASGTAPFNNFAGKLAAGRNLLALYDIHFIETLSGETWQPAVGTTVEVALSRVQLADYTDIQVHHELVSGALERVSSAVNGTVVSFDGASFSRYGVSGVKSKALPNTGSGDVTGLLLAGFGALLGGVVVLRARRRA